MSRRTPRRSRTKAQARPAYQRLRLEELEHRLYPGETLSLWGRALSGPRPAAPDRDPFTSEITLATRALAGSRAGESDVAPAAFALVALSVPRPYSEAPGGPAPQAGTGFVG